MERAWAWCVRHETVGATRASFSRRSSHERFEKVSSRMQCGGTPASVSACARIASVLDLPLPAHEWTVMLELGSAVATMRWKWSRRPSGADESISEHANSTEDV